MRLSRGRGVGPGGSVREMLGGSAGDAPPEGAKRAAFAVLEAEGLSCDTGRWIVRALLRLDASVWLEAPGSEPLQVTDRGRWAFAGRSLWARFYEGTELEASASGPDADAALRALVEMAALEPSERKAHYRARYAGRPPAGTRGRACEVCGHPERDAIDAELRAGASPRAVRKAYPGVSRAALASHRDGCGAA